MGYYVNPPVGTKEDWLRKNGIELSTPPNPDETKEGFLPVCLVDNGHMTAAGIAYSPDEVRAFQSPGDPRPKTWFLVGTKALAEVIDLAELPGHRA
jgi:hypothetical protein